MDGGAKRILIVDDEPDLRTYLSVILEDHGYETQTADDSETGLAAVQAAPPDLITLDISMPSMSGMWLYRILKQNAEWRHIPVVIVTGTAAELKDFISARDSLPRPEGYLHKPPDPRDLIATIARLIGS